MPYENKRLLKVTASQLHRESDNISETIEDKRQCYQRALTGSEIWLIK